MPSLKLAGRMAAPAPLWSSEGNHAGYFQRDGTLIRGRNPVLSNGSAKWAKDFGALHLFPSLFSSRVEGVVAGIAEQFRQPQVS